MAWERAGDAARRVAARQRPDDDDTPPAGGGGAALQGQPLEFGSDRDDRSEQGRAPHAPRSRIGRTTMAQGPRPEGPSDAPTADRGKAIGCRPPVAMQVIGQFARGLAAIVVEQRWRAVDAAELDEELVTMLGKPASPEASSQALAAGLTTGRQLGA